MDYLINDSQIKKSSSASSLSAVVLEKDLDIDKFAGNNHVPANQDDSTRTVSKNDLHNKILTQTALTKKYETNFNVNTTAPSKTDMSCESINIVGNLPDLSFMLSPVLMFPVRDYGNNDENS